MTFHFTQSKSQGFYSGSQGAVSLLILTSLIPSHILLFAPSALATLTSLLFLEHARHLPILTPLLWQFPRL